MLRYKTKSRPGLVALYDIRPGKERVHSYNPGARTGRRKLERRYRRSRPTWIGNPGLTRYTKSTPTSKTRTPSTGRAVFHATVPTQQSCGSRCRSFSEVRNNNALLQATPHTAVTFLKFFRDKVQAVRSGTGNAPAPVIRQMTSAMLSSLQPDRQRRFVAWSSSRQQSPVCPIQFPRSC